METIKPKKHIGVWMDHSSANVMELHNKEITNNKVMSEFTQEEKAEALSRSETIMHNKEQGQQHTYYKKISFAIKDCDKVILFGPTTAKAELLNLLKQDHHFDNIKIELKDSDKLTENQQHAFVKEHFKE